MARDLPAAGEDGDSRQHATPREGESDEQHHRPTADSDEQTAADSDEQTAVDSDDRTAGSDDGRPTDRPDGAGTQRLTASSHYWLCCALLHARVRELEADLDQRETDLQHVVDRYEHVMERRTPDPDPAGDDKRAMADGGQRADEPLVDLPDLF